MSIPGKDFLLKIGDGEAVEVFTTIGQLRATRLVINNSEVDITNKDSNNVRQLLVAASVKSYQISGDGVFDDGVAAERLRSVAESGTPAANFQLIDGTGDKYQGEMQVSSLEIGGPQGDSVTYSLTLANTGVLARSAVV